MNNVWNLDNITISGIAVCDISCGTTLRGTGTKGRQPFEWEAVLTAKGWDISISSMRGRIGTFYSSATFNLTLEVASVAARFTF